VPIERFLKANIKVKNGRVFIRLPIERVGKQIKIRWGKDVPPSERW
jgi:hypothetical protein